MDKTDIKICEEYYYNTTGAFNTPISQKCKVIDIGQLNIWIMIRGNLGPTPVQANKLSKEPLFKVTNEQFKYNM